jgi:hypothetical protein
MPGKKFQNAVPACIILRKKLTERHSDAFRHKNTPDYHCTAQNFCKCFKMTPIQGDFYFQEHAEKVTVPNHASIIDVIMLLFVS